MKKILSFFIALLLLGSLSACSSEKENPDKSQFSQKPDAKPSQFLDEFLDADWLNYLPQYKWEDVKKTDNTLSYDFKKDEVSGVDKSVSYVKNNSGTYDGTMKISFNKTNDRYIANIPKAFASHVDKLNFSIDATNIINPDPVVEFENIDGELIINSLETKSEAEIESQLEQQIIETELKQCEELSGNEVVACSLSLVAKYRDSKYMKEEIKDLNMAEVIGASVQAVFQKNLGLCKKFINKRDEQMYCYEYSYQILVKECNAFEDKPYRDCVRNLSNSLPTVKEKRLFCAYIDNEEMRAECQGIAELETCDDIADEENMNLCKLNILRTNNNLQDCEKIIDNDYKEMCVALIGADREDAGICMKVNDEYIKGQCLAKIAMVKQDKNICSKINDDDSRNLCNGYFILKMQASEEMCANTNELFLKEMCQMVLAINNKDTWKCSDPETVSYENQFICFAGMAVKHNDASLCAKIDITLGEFEEDRKIKETMRDACYSQIAINKPDVSLCDNVIDTKKQNECKEQLSKPVTKEEKTDEEKLTDYPPMPDWFNCPIPEGTKLYIWKNKQQSGYRWTDPKYANRRQGPYLKWWGEDFTFPNEIICYNAEGEEHGPFKKWVQGKDILISEGNYKNGKLDGIVKQYANGHLFQVITYTNGIKNGPTESYCTIEGKKCSVGDLASKGFYKDGYKSGFWSLYENGVFKVRQEFIKGEVTRDETGMSIQYYSE